MACLRGCWSIHATPSLYRSCLISHPCEIKSLQPAGQRLSSWVPFFSFSFFLFPSKRSSPLRLLLQAGLVTQWERVRDTPKQIYCNPNRCCLSVESQTVSLKSHSFVVVRFCSCAFSAPHHARLDRRESLFAQINPAQCLSGEVRAWYLSII